jgi:hypothetical protein
MELAEEIDGDFETLHTLLSRYFGHISNLDIVRTQNELTDNPLFANRSRMIPAILIIEVGNCIINCIKYILSIQGITNPKVLGGRDPKFQYDIKKYTRIASYVMCEKHSRKKAVKVETTFKNMKDITGEILMTDLYRGGMEIIRFGSSDDKINIKSIAEVGIFAIGKGNAKHIKVKQINKYVDNQKYELSWPKKMEVDSILISLITAFEKTDILPLFDFLNEFIDLVLLYVYPL